MRILTCVEPSLQSHRLLSRLHGPFIRGLGRALALVLLVAARCGSARAQYVGYAANSADGTVSVFAVVTSGPIFGNQVAPGNQDHLIATVPVGKTPLRIAVTPSPNFNRAYVTNQGDNSLWIVDVTNISQGNVTAQVVPNANNQLQLSQPSGIAIVNVTQGTNTGRVFAFVANQGSNSVSVVDTQTNTLFGSVSLGLAGTSTTLPEVAATPDGTRVFLTNNSSGNCGAQPIGFPPAICPGVWMIDTTVNPMSATLIPVSGLNGNVTVNLVQPQGISAAKYTDSQSQTHNVVLVADSGAHSDGNGYIFVIDDLGATTTITPIAMPNVVGGATPSPTGVAVAVDIGNCPPGDCVPAAVIDQSHATLWEIQDVVQGGLTINESTLNGTPTSLAVANVTSGVTTFNLHFVYIAESSGPTPIQQNAFSAGQQFGVGNATSVNVGNGPTGLAFSLLDPNSPPVMWFIPSVSGGFGPPPPVVTANSGLSVTGESMVGAGQAINTTLSFGGNNLCTLFGTSTTGSTCIDSNSGTNAIGGNTTFPVGGVFTVSITSSSTNSNQQPTQTTIQQQVSVGANCTSLVVTPNGIIVGQSVNATLTCTGPAGHTLNGTFDWGDGSTSQFTGTGQGSVLLVFNFGPHRYTSLPAPPNNFFLVGAGITDPTVPNTVFSIAVGVGVTTPTCTLTLGPNPAQPQQTVTATLTCAAAAGDSVTATINWGDGTTSPQSTSTANSSNVATLTFTHVYSTASNPTFPVTAAATDTTVTIAAAVTSPPINVAVGLACTLSVSPTTAGTGATVTANLNCAAPAGNSLSGTVAWGDGTTSPPSTTTANSSGAATLSFTHAYSTPSNPTYTVTAAVTDTAIGLSTIVAPSSVAITVTTPTSPVITPPSQPQPIVQGQPVVVPMTFTGGAADAGITFTTISCQVSPAGPTCSVSPSTLTLDANGNGTVQVTVTTTGPSTALIVPQSGSPPASHFASLIALPGLVLMFLGVMAFTGGSRRRVPLVLSFLFITCIAMLGVGCGTTIQRSNISCTTCTTAGSYTVTVTASSQKPVLQASGVFTIVVKP